MKQLQSRSEPVPPPSNRAAMAHDTEKVRNQGLSSCFSLLFYLLLLCCSFNDAISCSGHTAFNYRIWKEALWPKSEHYPSSSVDGLRKIKRHSGQPVSGPRFESVTSGIRSRHAGIRVEKLNSRRRVLFEKLIISQPVKTFTAYHGIAESPFSQKSTNDLYPRQINPNHILAS